ncbi:MAG TPA: DinB family protein [Gemmatimonadaceae bacterium]
MSKSDDSAVARWASIVASALTWEQAHASLDQSVRNLAPALQGKRPANYPHSVWELLDHIRRTQHDLLEFCTNPKYHEPKWPDDYWPGAPEPPNTHAWIECLAAIHADAQALADFTVKNAAKLTETIPHGTGQTYLRTVLVAVDHTSYHTGQIVAVRRLLGAWPP